MRDLSTFMYFFFSFLLLLGKQEGMVLKERVTKMLVKMFVDKAAIWLLKYTTSYSLLENMNLLIQWYSVNLAEEIQVNERAAIVEMLKVFLLHSSDFFFF